VRADTVDLPQQSALAAVRQLLLNVAAAGVDGVRQLAGRPQRYIIVASHMRSGSSLLHHLLQTNRSILGAGESNRSYRSPSDFRRFSLWAHADRDSLFHWYPFVADQINHTGKLSDSRLLRRADVRTIILIREPLGTIASLMRLADEFYGSTWNEHDAIHYYIERIGALVELARALNTPPASPAFLLTYEQLVNDSVASLAALQHHLELTDPFSTTYETFDYTQTRGDPTWKIGSKRIVSGEGRSTYALPIEWRSQVEDRYQAIVSSLSSTCVSA
jgi:hypothetical protein